MKTAFKIFIILLYLFIISCNNKNEIKIKDYNFYNSFYDKLNYIEQSMKTCENIDTLKYFLKYMYLLTSENSSVDLNTDFPLYVNKSDIKNDISKWQNWIEEKKFEINKQIADSIILLNAIREAPIIKRAYLFSLWEHLDLDIYLYNQIIEREIENLSLCNDTTIKIFETPKFELLDSINIFLFDRKSYMIIYNFKFISNFQEFFTNETKIFAGAIYSNQTSNNFSNKYQSLFELDYPGWSLFRNNVPRKILNEEY